MHAIERTFERKITLLGDAIAFVRTYSVLASDERKEVTDMTAKKYWRPEELATELGLSGKVVRSYLRRTFPRPIEAKGSTWVLNAEQRDQTIEYFAAKNPIAHADSNA